MSSNKDTIPVVSLFGSSEENFYQLGLKDRESHSDVLNHIKGLIKSPWQRVDKAVQQVAGIIANQGLNHCPGFQKRVLAYAEGLDADPADITLAIMIPEIVSFMTRWVPGIPTSLLGCSSFFAWDEQTNSPMHGRVLDFPLQGTYDKRERAIYSKLDNGPTMLSFSATGFPYPSITTLTSEGVTFALHQKFTDTFNSKGIPIFELIFQMLQNCGDLESTVEFLKKNNSITTWAFYMSFQNGDVLACDVMGEDKTFNTYKIEPGKIIYFNNCLENPRCQKAHFLPMGIAPYNKMRWDVADQKIKTLSKEKNLNQLKLLKAIATPVPTRGKTSATNWKMDTVTPSSISIMTMNAKSGESLYLPGPAPKFYQKDYLKFENCFSEDGPKQSLKSSTKTKTSRDKILGNRSLMEAQTCWDRSDYHGAYHNIQMAIDLFDGMPESFIARFFFAVLQYIHEPHEKVRNHLLAEFYELKDKLPPYLNDHCILFIARLEKILQGKTTMRSGEIQHELLRKIMAFERKLPRLFFHKATAVLMNPRIDNLDVIYAHVKAI
ncbi:MAG: hypothetical protein EP326_05500 [Deltaproteobacteria bacterium]|nr:MAG: hypothetical protein EP326_05500 [Deltaproteobacteria bacterium]TNF31488.1 MAG: hypothetical protein EP319_02010 [Deltaproteobacteria bacterium]